jgi:hypothetical protein
MKKRKLDYYVINGEVLYMDFQEYLQKAEKTLNFNHAEMARMLKVPYRSYQNWVRGDRFPAYPTREYLKNKIDLLLAIYANGGIDK